MNDIGLLKYSPINVAAKGNKQLGNKNIKLRIAIELSYLITRLKRAFWPIHPCPSVKKHNRNAPKFGAILIRFSNISLADLLLTKWGKCSSITSSVIIIAVTASEKNNKR
jgi:hypothetical protein